MSGDTPLVVAAVSGGVDSSVAAAILVERGFRVACVTLRLKECTEGNTTGSCCGENGIRLARATAGMLGSPHYVVDCASQFDEKVLLPAWREYTRGRTPSPCLLCNERIKFGILLEHARKMGARHLATGHYAIIGSSLHGHPFLLRALDRSRDQSYFLSGLDREQLSSAVFPVGRMTKTQVREKARSLGLPSSDEPDSQDACLSGGSSFAEKLRERFGEVVEPGVVVDENGRVLGRHDGIHRFTVGQRKGLGCPADPCRHWVTAISAGDGTVHVSRSEDSLFTDRLVAVGMVWTGRRPGVVPIECEVQIRSSQQAVPARIDTWRDDSVTVLLMTRVRAAAPGQAAVFYDGDRVLGRGWIREHG